MIIEAQFGLLEVGMTPRACREKEPSWIIRRMFGVLEFITPLGLIPSQPTIMTCFTPRT
jgi:hypothetical protein